MKIATWNVCLGLKNKKIYVREKILEEQIDICCIQECDIPSDYPSNILSFRNYNLEVENNSIKARCCTFVRSSMGYIRRNDLEGEDNNIVILEITLNSNKFLIINIYRSFSPQGGVSPDVRFTTQLGIIKDAIIRNSNMTPVLLGDFNLDYNKIHNINYNNKRLFELLNNTILDCNLIQLVDFTTWSRNIAGIIKESMIDHVYIKDTTVIKSLTHLTPAIGDHRLITLTLLESREPPTKSLKRNWKYYSKDLLLNKLSICTFDYNITNVQQFWNHLENKIICVVDSVAPLTEFTNNLITATCPQNLVKPLINKKRRLLKDYKLTKNLVKLEEIKILNNKIVNLCKINKRNSIRRCIIPGNNKSLWNAVNLAKDVNPNSIPKIMKHNGIEIAVSNLSDAFADFFDKKVKDIVSTCEVDNDVYNGTRKVTSPNSNFVTIENVNNVLKSMKIKNCEGYDRIPQRILNEGSDCLLYPITHLLKLVYENKQIPHQWSISKIIPIHKKGPKTNIENYRPIANLCSMTKVFEQLIINRIREIEKLNLIDITGNPQHGFKQKRSTATAGLTIQSLLSHALDRNEYALMSSIDLSAAFDVVNVKLLVKRLRIVGLPSDVIELIKIWLSNRMFYVDINGSCSYIKTSESGTIQGSRLGPILYAIYVSPLFDIEKMTNYADDNLIVRWNNSLVELITDMEKSLEAITKWLKKSGLKVNESKTEICLFHRLPQNCVTLTVNGFPIQSKQNMNVLGVLFDSRLQWHDQIALTIKKSNAALHGLKQIRYFFNPNELLTLITSNYYSILYYNSEIWNIPTLHIDAKQKLLSASANALKICTPSYHDRMSFIELHTINKRGTPTQMCNYKLALLLYKLINERIPYLDWMDLNFQQTFNSRQYNFNFYSINTYRVGCNNICNRLRVLNGKIDLNSINQSYDSFKVMSKELLLS